MHAVYTTTCTGWLRCTWGHAGIVSQERPWRGVVEQKLPCFQPGYSMHRQAPSLPTAVSCMMLLHAGV